MQDCCCIDEDDFRRMLDVQKDRFRQMVATAILDLWKKETGSLASVFIEATVCITSCSSRMTVIQVSDHFPGLIPEPPMLLDKIHSPGNDMFRPSSRQCHLAGQKRKLVEHYQDMAESSRIGWLNESLQTTFDKQKDSRATPLGQAVQQDQRLLMDSNNNQTELVDAEGEGDYSEGTDKEEMSSEDSDMCEGASSDAEDAQDSPLPRSSSMVPVCAGTGYYTTSAKSYAASKDKNSTVKADRNDSGIQDMSTGSLVIDMSTTEDDAIAESKATALDTKWHHMNSAVENASVQKSGETNAVDLSQHDTDLILSPPQNYTEQVRDVIRSRLLNGKPKLTTSKSASTKEHVMDYFPMSAASALSTPKSNEVHAVAALCRPFDGPGWPLIKREKPSSMNGRMIPQHYTSSPLPLHPLHKNLLDSMSTSAMAAVHPSLHKLFGLNSALELPESKVFADSANEPDEEEKQHGSYAGAAQQFADQKGAADSAINNAEQKSYKCNYCQKTFLFKSKYHEHLPVHTSARPFECHMCTRTYKYKYDLRVHLRTHLGIPTKSTICPFCSGKFMTNKLLRHHIKEAHREQQQISEEQCALSLDCAPMLSPTVGSSI